MLEMRPNCECCDQDLPADSAHARMCSFECTFCSECATQMAERCPNCGGELLARPRRPAAMIEKYPASTRRVLKESGCGTQGA